MSEERWIWVPFEVDKRFDGFRIDRFLARRLAGYSRHRVQRILSDARVLKEGRPAKASAHVRMGQKIQIAYLWRPEAPLNPNASIPVLFEDDDLLIVNKPADLLSHPTDKTVNHTVLGVLRHARPDLPKLRLLHRLDRETSGALALAKNEETARSWNLHMEARHIRKEYIAVVRGVPSPPEGVIDFSIGREGGDIKVRQWVNVPGAVPAVTRYRILKAIPHPSPSPFPPLSRWRTRQVVVAGKGVGRGEGCCSIVQAMPETGRLHQIRVHFAAIGHPLLGDPLYTGRGELYKKMIAGQLAESDRASLGLARLALHAAALTFPHPRTPREVRVEAPCPEDLSRLISATLSP